MFNGLKDPLQNAPPVGQFIMRSPHTKASLTSSGKSLFDALVSRPNY